jgi:hypothetical protein
MMVMTILFIRLGIFSSFSTVYFSQKSGRFVVYEKYVTKIFIEFLFGNNKRSSEHENNIFSNY